MIDRPVPLVPRTLRLEVRERLAADGEVLVPLDERAVQPLARRIVAEGVKSVAIGFLHAYAHDAHEKRVRELLAKHSAGGRHHLHLLRGGARDPRI